MLTTVVLAAAFALVLASGGGCQLGPGTNRAADGNNAPADNAAQDNRGAAADRDSPEAARQRLVGLKARLSEIVVAEWRSYQRLVWRATHACQRALLERPWPVVEPALESQKLSIVETRHELATDTVRFLAQRGAFTTRTRLTHDLLVELSYVRERPHDGWAAVGTVVSARAVLVAQPGTPLSEVLQAAPYRAGTALAHVLKLDVCRDAGAEYPVLAALEIGYDVIADRWRDAQPLGFYVAITLTKSASPGAAGTRLGFAVESRLDPPVDVAGIPAVPPESYASTDTLGAIIAVGQTRWPERK